MLADTMKQHAHWLLKGESGPLGKDNLLSVIESVLEPLMLVFSLWVVAIQFEGGLARVHLVMSVIVFLVSFPGKPRLNSHWAMMLLNVVGRWLLTASILLLAAAFAGYLPEFSRRAMLAWLVLAPLCQIGAHLLLRLLAPYLIRLQGPAQRAVIVGMNEQGVALASRVSETPYSRIEFFGFFDDRDPRAALF